MAISVFSSVMTIRFRGNSRTAIAIPTGTPISAAKIIDQAETLIDVQTAPSTSPSKEKMSATAVFRDSRIKPKRVISSSSYFFL